MANYTPINIFSNFAKIFEHISYCNIYHTGKPYLSVNQDGYTVERPTVINLANLTQYIVIELDQYKQVRIIYTNFSKALRLPRSCYSSR